MNMTQEKIDTSGPQSQASIDDREVDKFAQMAAEWWDPSGKFKPLHQLNPVRLQYIKDEVGKRFTLDCDDMHPFKGLSVLDVGCGGGLLCEPMARLGATVTGIDVAQESIMIAKRHAEDHGLDIDYRFISAEELLQKGESFDIVLNMEVVEHVSDVDGFVKTCGSLVKPDGIMLMSTLNRTLKSFALGIVAAEYVLKWLPKGTHHWEKFITPSELAEKIEKAGLRANKAVGATYNPLTGNWSLSSDTDVNYMVSGIPA